MAEETVIKVKRDGSFTFTDNAGLTYTVAYEAGDGTINIPGPSLVLFLDRGRITSPPALRYGDDQPITFSFSAALRDVTASDVAVLNDILCQTGYVSSTWQSTMGANGEVFTTTLGWGVVGAIHGGADATYSLPYSFVTGSLQEGDPTMINISGTAHVLYPTIS